MSLASAGLGCSELGKLTTCLDPGLTSRPSVWGEVLGETGMFEALKVIKSADLGTGWKPKPCPVSCVT